MCEEEEIERMSEALGRLESEVKRLRSENMLLTCRLEERWSLVCEVEDLLGVSHGPASDEQLQLGVAALRRLVADRDEALAKLERLQQRAAGNVALEQVEGRGRYPIESRDRWIAKAEAEVERLREENEEIDRQRSNACLLIADICGALSDCTTDPVKEIERLREEASEWQQIAAFVAGDLAKEILLDADAVDGILEFARGEVRRANAAIAGKEPTDG